MGKSIIIDEKCLRERLNRRLGEDLQNHRIGNASLLVMQGEKLLYEGYHGERIWGSEQKPDENTLYRLASMTKPITAVAILLLRERGLLRLDDRVEEYLPAYRSMQVGMYENNRLVEKNPLQEQVQIFHLLTHTSGIGNRVFTPSMSMEDKRDLERAVAYYAKGPLAFEPYTQASYSPTAGFDILARIVEVISGKNFAQFLQEEIFLPLGMINTTFLPTPMQWANMSYMHRLQEGRSVEAEEYRRRIFSDHPAGYFCGGAGLASTLADYAKFTQMLLREGEYRGKRILQAESVRLLRTPQVCEKIMPLSWRWGLGVRVITSPQQRLPIGAYGWSGAYGGHFWVDPMNKIVGIYLKNSLYDGGSGALTAAHFEEDVYSSVK